MSISGISSNSDRVFRHTFRRRQNSDELDVFEAAAYYSSTVDNRPPGLSQTTFRKEYPSTGKSLNPPDFKTTADSLVGDRKDNKKFRRPSSPGAKLANFLSSLFNQTHLKKKKQRLGLNDTQESRFIARRSSFSTSRIPRKSSTDNDAKSTCSVPASQMKSAYHDFRRIFDRQRMHFPDEKLKIRTGRVINPGKFNEIDDDDDDSSDSSSDLFDLPNHGLCSSYSVSDPGLPVYGTTRLGRIRDIGSGVFGDDYEECN